MIKALRSNNFALFVAILSVTVQSFHSFTAFYNTSALQNVWGIAQAILFSIVIDLAILFYTVRRRKDIAMYAAVAMVTINAYYYYQHLGVTFEFIFGCFLSLIIPVSVYFYSEEIGEEIDIEGQKYNWRKAMDESIKVSHERAIETNKVIKERDELREHLDRRLEDLKNMTNERDRALILHKEAYDRHVAEIGELENKLNITREYAPQDKSLIGVEKSGQDQGEQAKKGFTRTNRAAT